MRQEVGQGEISGLVKSKRRRFKSVTGVCHFIEIYKMGHS